MLNFLLTILIWTFYEKMNFSYYDLKTDTSITKFVNNKISFTNLKYVPDNLIKLEWKNILDAKWNSKVRKIVNEKLNLLADDFYEKFNKKLKIVSAYRSYNYQKWIKNRWCPDLFCAKAWYSEHQSWLAIDFWEASTLENYLKNDKLNKKFEWMKKNWIKHGFTNTYQKGFEIDGYVIEPWHWRYVWKELAEYLYENNLTFAEFFYKNK